MLSLFLRLIMEESMPAAVFSMQDNPRGRPETQALSPTRKPQHQEGACTAERNSLSLSSPASPEGAAPQLKLLAKAQRLDLTLN